MSYAAERWARAQTVGDARAKQVLIELAHCMNSRTGLCNPGREYLHVVTELKLSTISAATTRLEQLGFIRKIGSKGVSLRYEFPKFDPEEWKESKAETGLGTESYSVQNRTWGEAETVPTTKAETVPRVGPKPAHKQGINRERNKEANSTSMRTSGKTSANAAVASAQAQTPYPDDFDQSLFDEAEREARSFPEPLPEPPALPSVEQPASTPARPKMAYPPCQYEKVVELYHTNCKGLTRVLVLSDARKRTINARWREFCKEDDLKTVQEALDGFDWYFKEAAKSRFLMGFSNPGPGRDRPFKADFDWLMRPNNFLKVCEGKYANGIQK